MHGEVEVQIWFIFDYICFNVFLKKYIVGTPYSHLVEILICTLSNKFYEEISKEFSDSFYLYANPIGDWFTKDSQDCTGKKNN